MVRPGCSWQPPSTTAALWISLTLYPLFGILDYLAAPLLGFGCCSGREARDTQSPSSCWWWSSRPFFSAALQRDLGGVHGADFFWGSAMMTLFMGGLASPYYAGLTLTIVASGLLFVWPTQGRDRPRHVSSPRLSPEPAVSRGPLSLTAISNLLFLVSTAIIAGAGQMLAYALAARASREPAHHRKDEEEPRVCEPRAQEARPLQVRVLRQHHPRAQDAAHHDARARSSSWSMANSVTSPRRSGRPSRRFSAAG